MVTNLEYQNYLQLMEPGYLNLSPRDASTISSGCAKTKVACHQNDQTAREKNSYALFLNSGWPIVQV